MSDTEEAEAPVADDNGPKLWWVALYLVDRAYGGPEEGGWYYDCGTLVTDASVYHDIQRIPAAFWDEEVAQTAADFMTARADVTVNRGRRSINSVLSTGRYEARVFEGWPPTHYPAEIPRYE